MATEKRCTKCGSSKPLTEFNRNSASPGGYRPDCRVCQSARQKAYGQANKAKRRASSRSYYERTKEQSSSRSRAWIAANPEAYREINRRSKRKKLSTARGKIDRFLKDGIRASILHGSKRGRRTFELLNYTAEDLIAHIEAQFEPGMTWDNYGPVWHIDHIDPLSAHNYETPDHIDFSRAWSLTNLRPLWAKDNLEKHAKLVRPFQPCLML